jgi:hypothetical protein
VITVNPIPIIDPELRAQVVARYRWEVDALARDIRDKLEMGILTIERVPAYLSDLLRAHPRLTDLDRSAETVWASPCTPKLLAASDKLAPLDVADSPVKMLAYSCMGWDVINTLTEVCGLRWK